MPANLPMSAFPRALKALYNFFANSPNLIETFEDKSAAGALSLTKYQSRLTVTLAATAFTLGNGAGVTVGTRKLITCAARTAPGTAALDHANIVDPAGTQATAVVLDAANEFILVEWRGAKWHTIAATAGVVSV